MVALNRFQPPSAAGPAQSHVSISGSAWNAECSVSPALAAFLRASQSARLSPRSSDRFRFRQIKLGSSVFLFSLFCFVSVLIKTFHLNRSVLCWSRWVRASVISRSRDPHTASITFQCIPGHDPSRRFHCTSGLPSGLQHGASVRSVTLINLTLRSSHCVLYRHEWGAQRFLQTPQ